MTNRILRIVLLLLWFELGVTLILLPWSDYWDVNYFLFQYPSLGLDFKKFLPAWNDFGTWGHEHHVRIGSFPQTDAHRCRPLLTIRPMNRPPDSAVRRYCAT